MEMEEVFKTAGFRVREAEARGSCRGVDADRDDARRAVKRVADGLVAERHEGVGSDLELVGRQPSAHARLAESALWRRFELSESDQRLRDAWLSPRVARRFRAVQLFAAWRKGRVELRRCGCKTRFDPLDRRARMPYE